MHILATQIATLEETESAVDLAHSPADVVVMSFSDSDLSALAAAWSEDGALPSLRLADLKRLKHPMSIDLYIDGVVTHAKAVVLRCLGGFEYWRYGLERLAAVAKARGIMLAALPGDDRPDPRLAALSTLPPQALARLDNYFRAGGTANLRQALRYLAALMGGDCEWEEPEPLGPIAGFYPGRGAMAIEGLQETSDPRPTALVIFYRALLTAGDTAPISALMHALDGEGLSPVGVAVSSLKDAAISSDLERLIAARRPRIILNATAFSALREDGTTVLDAAGAPVLQVVLAGSSREAWTGSARGLSAVDQAMNVVFPELDGRLLTRAVSFKGESLADPALEYACLSHHPEPDRIDYVAKLAASWARLSEKPRGERRIALILSDYPARGGRAGYAVGLDTVESTARIADLLASKGFDVGPGVSGRDVEALLNGAGATALMNGVGITGTSSAEAEGLIGRADASALQNGTKAGAMMRTADVAALLADAGAGAPPTSADVGTLLNKSTRDGDFAISLPTYRKWLAKLPKGLADQIARCWGDPADDPSVEGGAFRMRCLRAGKLLIALQPDRGAKSDRKSSYHNATIPPRHGYVAFYAWLRQAATIDALIHLGTHGTLEWLPGKALALSESCWPEAVLGPVPVIYPFIVNNPGEAVQAKRRIAAVTIGHLTPPMRSAGLHGRLAALENLVEEYASADGFDRRRAEALEQAIIDAAHDSGLPAECGLAPNAAGRDVIARLDAHLCDIKELSIRDRFHVFARPPGEEDRNALAQAIEAGAPADLTDAERAWISRTLTICADREGEALIRALDGRRIAAGPAGAPTRGRLDVMPTGRNLTSIDPRAIPTRTAATIGKCAAEEVIRRYLQDHGEYPRALLLTLWASASLRSGGDDLAQALHYLGAVPVWDALSGRVSGIEIVPLAKLGRPRIDVTLRISGLFRDLFETQITLFDLALRQVAALSEDPADNPLAEAYRQGDDLARIFGGAPGSYGAGVSSIVLETAWTCRAELGRAALNNVTHCFAIGELEGTPHEGFGARLAASSALVQPQDTAERDILDGDDIADFAGGMAAAAALLGAKPVFYHLDTSRPATPRARTMAESIARVVHGRLTNPRWLTGMVQHGHRGIAEIAQGIDALYALAATAEAVPAHLFEAVHNAVIADEAFFTSMMAHNPAAAAAIARKLHDAFARGIWTARRNAVAEELSGAVARCTGGRMVMGA